MHRLATFLKWLVLALVMASAGFAQVDEQKAAAQSFLTEASRLISQIQAMQQPAASANVAGLQVLAGDTPGAFLTAQSLPKKADQAPVAGSIAYSLTREGQAPLALEYIRDSADGIAKAQAYLWVAQRLAMDKDFEGARNAARLIGQDPTQSNILVDTLMRIYAEEWKTTGDKSGAEDILNEALAAVNDRMGTAEEKVSGYFCVVNWLVEAGNKLGATAIVESIRTLTEDEQQEATKQGMLRSLAIMQATVGDFRAALNTAWRIPPGSDRDAAFEVIAMTQSKTDPNTAIQNANAVSYAPWRISSLQSIADGLAASGHQARAVALLDLIQSPADRAYGLASMALRQAEKGSADAPLTAELAWEAAMNARDEVAPSTLGFIAVARGYLGDFAGALQIVNGLSTEARAWPLWCLTEMLVAADKTQEAIGVAESQEDPLPKVYALLGLARGLIEDTAQPKEKQSHQKGQP